MAVSALQLHFGVLDEETVSAVLETYKGDLAGAMGALADISAHRSRRGHETPLSGGMNGLNAHQLPIGNALRDFAADIAKAWLEGPLTEEERSMTCCASMGGDLLLRLQDGPRSKGSGSSRRSLRMKGCKDD
ncbi:hypothetical protein Agub_g12543 [Astrephomene gubernaculifera]|uniref:CUE domain-containing protein n=1 Tax=Astrephomene gubernaculifera TaxID=47775 RepID=A0AAD3DYD1_9CHLO|nr:hypothetical protein Agub_g12543 [Astrephomene gubernaculifera]